MKKKILGLLLILGVLGVAGAAWAQFGGKDKKVVWFYSVNQGETTPLPSEGVTVDTGLSNVKCLFLKPVAESGGVVGGMVCLADNGTAARTMIMCTPGEATQVAMMTFGSKDTNKAVDLALLCTVK